MSEAPTAGSHFDGVGRTAVGIAHWVRERHQGGSVDRGDRAQLRRMRPDALPPEPFWRLVARFAIEARDEPYWIALVPLMVVHPHGELTPGRALAMSRVSAPRVERWLRLDRSRARREAGRLLARCEHHFDWGSFARLTYSWTERERRRFARDFFLAPELRPPSSMNESTKEDRA